jgi:hypothetical protein
MIPTWVLILHFSGYSGVAPTIPGYETREECVAVGEEFKKLRTYANYYCIPGPRRAR